ncbi:MAG: hypothetical protein ABFC90_07170 [Bacteroidales bacterium]|nr:hypothetical protein [Bacteroidales bacterium]
MEGVKNFRFFRRPEWQSAAMPEGGQRLKESCTQDDWKTRFGNSAFITAFLAFSAQRRKATAPKRRSALKETNVTKRLSSFGQKYKWFSEFELNNMLLYISDLIYYSGSQSNKIF